MRRVDTGKSWYSEEVVSFDEAFDSRNDEAPQQELSVDVWKRNGQWIVTTRNSFTRGTDFFTLEGWKNRFPSFDKLKTAKVYAADIIALYKANPEIHYTDFPKDHDDKYFNLDVYGTEIAPL